MSIPKASSVATRYLQIPLKVQPDYGSDESQAAVPRGKEAGTMMVRQMVRVRVRTFGAKDIGEGKTEVSGVMNIDFGDTEILPLRFTAEVAGTFVNSFKPLQPISGAGADKVLAFYRSAFEQALQANPGKLASKTADSDWAKLFPRNSYLNKFFAEKRIPYKMFDITDSHGIVHSIPNDVVVEAIAQTGPSERKKIEDTIRKIDFANGDVNHFFAHLAKALAEQYSGALRFASDRQAFNKYNPDDLLTALVDILEKYELDDVAKEVKKLTPVVQKAWRSRET